MTFKKHNPGRLGPPFQKHDPGITTYEIAKMQARYIRAIAAEKAALKKFKVAQRRADFLDESHNKAIARRIDALNDLVMANVKPRQTTFVMTPDGTRALYPQPKKPGEEEDVDDEVEGVLHLLSRKSS